MSDKLECPGCESYTSSVLFAVRNGQPCPSCGLPADAIVAVNRVQESRGDKALRAELSSALIRAAKAEAELTELREFVNSLRSDLNRLGYTGGARP